MELRFFHLNWPQIQHDFHTAFAFAFDYKQLPMNIPINKLEMNFKPNKHELYLLNREKEREF